MPACLGHELQAKLGHLDLPLGNEHCSVGGRGALNHATLISVWNVKGMNKMKRRASITGVRKCIGATF